MSLDYWLHEATGTFPRGVRERLAQEYTAHLEDSVAAGGVETRWNCSANLDG